MFLIFWSIALVFTVTGLLFLTPLLKALGADPILMPYARDYATIILAGAITSTGFSALIRAEGNVKYSLYIWVFPVLLNLVFDPVFIFGFGWGVKGAAASTVLGQAVSAGMSIYYFFFSKRDAYKIRREHFRPDRKVLVEIISIGSPSLISQVSMSFYVAIINRMLFRMGGADAITAYGIVSRIQSFLVMPQNGIVQGLQPIVGYNFSAGKYKRLKSAFWLSVTASFVYGAFILCISMFGANFLMGIFVTEQNILMLGASILVIIALGFPFKGISVLVSAMYQSMGKTIHSISLLLFGIFAIQLPLIFILGRFWGINGIWYSFCLADLFIGVISLASMIGSSKKLKQGEKL